ncbi:hypothetical protein TNCV_3288171 [Trichonephila clavipes]|nr:hypothetical protein TNCV_3288171 [Trichonephila clavipes]
MDCPDVLKGWKTGRREKKEGEREKERKELEKTRAGRFRKRRGEPRKFLFHDADQASRTRIRKNALRTGPRQAVERIVTPSERDERLPPSGGRGTEKNNLFKIVEGKEFNVYRNSDCEVKMKAGLCEGRVKAVAKGAQRVINPDNI